MNAPEKTSLAVPLLQQGYVDRLMPSEKEIKRAVREYQRDHNLHVDGEAGPRTRRALHDPFLQICGCDHAEMRRARDDRCRWPNKSITWAIDGQVPGLSALDVKAAFATAYASWSRVCGIQPEYTANVKTAAIVSRVGKIDRPGATLAWSELPCGAAKQLKQLYDRAERWVISKNPARFEIDLVRVAAHEIGHAIGIPHIGDGNLMQAAYDQNIRGPQAGDIAQATARYGEPQPFDGPSGDDGQDSAGEAQLTTPDGRVWSFPMDQVA